MTSTWKIELIPVPVTDVDRAKAFYQRIGFNADHDHRVTDTLRFVQLTPPGSACSIVFGIGIGDSSVPPGSVRNLHLVVDDIAAARQSLLDRGVPISAAHDMGGVKYAYFADPDGNSWALQEIPPGITKP